MDVSHSDIIKFINTKESFCSKDVYKHFAPNKISSTQMSKLLHQLKVLGCIEIEGKSSIIKKHKLLKKAPENIMRNYCISEPCVINVVAGNLSGMICSKEDKVVLSFNKKTIPETKKIFHSREFANEYIIKIKPRLSKNLTYNVIPL